ncbi:MAG: TonB-dependent receptor [Pseudomonadota bacterium]
MRRKYAALFTTLLTTTMATPAWADDQSAAATAPADEQPDRDRSQNIDEDDYHTLPNIIVTAPYVDDLNLLASKSVLEGNELTQELEPQIGEMLTKLPGVSATSFTPGASRPVLRGFQGPRILVLNDGLGTIDVSGTSADHAVTVEPLLLERIEVLQGPATLLFGGNALGGAVNSIDKRIPRAPLEDEPFHLDMLGSYASAANERSVGASLDFALGDNLVFHVDGNYRNTDDLEVGGFVLSPELRAEQLEIAAEETEEGNLDEAAEALELAELRDRIPNTATETYSFGSGLSWFGDGGMFGVSVSYFDSEYGVPERPGAEHAHGDEDGDDDEEEEEEGPVTIALEQVKVDFRGEIDLPGFFDKLTIRGAYADFEQIEFEGDEVGTVFENEGIEARAELAQSDRGGWRGASGIQYTFRDFSAIGAEAFVPPNETSQFGIFTVQEYTTGNFDIEGALRFDSVNSESQVLGIERNFDSVSGALGFGYTFDEGAKVGINFNRSERAPSPEELFSNGPHIATQAFEIGNPNFDTERSMGGEIYLRIDRPTWQFGVTVYYNDFENFLIDVPTGEEEDGLPVFQFIQNDAEFYGFEAQGSVVLARSGGFSFVADAVADYTEATLDNLGPVPRIPPLRVLGGLEAQSDTLNGRIEVEWFDDQDRNANFETETDGFTFVNAQIAWRPLGTESNVTLLASANNIFDVVGRRAASFTRDFAPLAGRDFRVSARLSF